MVAKCEMFMNYSKNFKGICKKQIYCQTWNTKGIIELQEEVWLTIVKYLRLSTLHRY